MATVSFIKYQKQSAGALRGVAQYVSQNGKTVDDNGRRLVSGQNCTPSLAEQEFQATRDMHRKGSPVWFYHYVQSFSPQEDITGERAHQLAREFAAQAWLDSEVLIATHTDAEHIHSHFIVNAVCWESGKMLRQGPNTLRTLRQLSDALCVQHGFSVLSKEQKKKKPVQGMSTREYRSAAKGESWKLRLMDTIDQCMKYAETKEEFISLMESEGYQVRWADSRKNITYTTPSGMKCRDDRLHETKYTKEVMEREFRIRAEIISGGIETAESISVRTDDDHTISCPHETGLGGSADRRQRPVPPGEDQQRPAGTPGGQRCGTGGPVSGVEPAGGATPHPGPAGGTGAGCGPNSGCIETGWEEARDFYFAAQSGDSPLRADLADSDFAGDYGWDGGLADDLVRLGRTLERSSDPDPVRDATTISHYTDRKALRREREKKIALGHKVDDHEEEQIWEQKM